ncbi:hypothetical protein GDO81_001447, partial [Engystomops pustulosus]
RVPVTRPSAAGSGSAHGGCGAQCWRKKSELGKNTPKERKVVIDDTRTSDAKKKKLSGEGRKAGSRKLKPKKLDFKENIQPSIAEPTVPQHMPIYDMLSNTISGKTPQSPGPSTSYQASTDLSRLCEANGIKRLIKATTIMRSFATEAVMKRQKSSERSP